MMQTEESFIFSLFMLSIYCAPFRDLLPYKVIGNVRYFRVPRRGINTSVMAMSVAVVSSYWLAHNLFKESGLTRELLGIASKRLVGAYSVTILMGVALGLYWLINNLIQTADLSETSIAVMEFPLILIGSYGLITFSQE